VGKSSVINTLREKKVCTVAPIPGETKVWQYITLFRKVFLIDCPGVVTPAANETEADVVLKGVLRVENLDDPSQYIPAIFDRTKKEYIEKTYDIKEYTSVEDFLEQYALKTGKLLKKGEPDVTAVSKMILNDWLRGRIPYFVPPPEDPAINNNNSNKKNPTETSNKQNSDRNTPEILLPKQKISSIRVRDEFQGLDNSRHMDEEDDDDAVSSEEGEEEEEREEKELEWEDVVESLQVEKE